MGDIIVVGKGPAGISAAIYAKRAGLSVTVIGKNAGALDRADLVENYYGFEAPIGGKSLVEQGIRQAQRLGIPVVSDEVVGLGYDGDYRVKTASGEELSSKSLVLCTGAGRETPKIEGFDRFAGKGISYCAVCDAFFYRGRDVAVLGCCDYALSEALELLPIARSVTLVTNGETPIAAIPPEIRVITQKITKIEGEEMVESLTFEDGESLPISGLFVAMGVAGSSDLAKKLGAETKGRQIVVSATMETTIPGLFAAGDCTGGLYQIAKAVHEGAVAGTGAVKFVRKSK